MHDVGQSGYKPVKDKVYDAIAKQIFLYRDDLK